MLIMPLYNVGYRGWDGERSSTWLRWWTIASTGIRLVWRGTWLRRSLIVTWIPAFFLATGFFMYEQSILHPDVRRGLAEWLEQVGQVPELAQSFENDPASVRHDVWAMLLLAYFRYPQAIAMAIVIGIIAPRLISYDLRSRGFLLYFSRPLHPWEYILGKSAIVWFYLALITTLPAMLMYLLGILLSPELTVIQSTWDLPFRILGATMIIALPTTALALAFSSLTIESRYAAFAWIATWVLGAVAYGILTAGEMAVEVQAAPPSEELFEVVAQRDTWRLVSLYQMLNVSQQWMFGLRKSTLDTLPCLVALLAIFVVSNIVIFRRVSRRMTS